MKYVITYWVDKICYFINQFMFNGFNMIEESYCEDYLFEVLGEEERSIMKLA